MLEYVAADALAWGIVGDPDADGGEHAAHSWAFGAETASVTVLEVRRDPAEATTVAEEADPENFERIATDVSIDADGAVVLATGTVPTDEYEYVDLFAERGDPVDREPHAGVAIDVDRAAREVTVTVVSAGNADAVEIRDDDGKRGEYAVGERATLKYDEGESGTVRAIAVRGERRAVVATHEVEF